METSGFREETGLSSLSRYEEAVRHAPENAENLLHYGKALWAEGIFEGAETILKRAFDLAPGPQTAGILADFHLDRGLPFSAVRVLERLNASGFGDEASRSRLTDLKKQFPPRRVTFYIPCYNQEKYIEGCILGIRAQSYPVGEIFVVDDGSTDRSIDIAGRYEGVRIIRHPQNMGLAAARNTAIREAEGEFLASVDTDAVADESWLERLMPHFSDPKIAGVGGKLIEAHSVGVTDRWRQIHMKQHWGDTGGFTLPEGFLFGSGAVFRIDALRKVGGYDEALRSNGEDCSISSKLMEKEWKLYYEPLAVARHLRRDDLAGVVSTHWRYLNPFMEQKRQYAVFEMMSEKVDFNIRKSSEWLNLDLAGKRYQLLYPSFIVPFRFTLLDVRHMFRHSVYPARVIGDTLAAVLAAMRCLVHASPNLSPALKTMVLDDLGGVVDVPFDDGTLDRLFSDPPVGLDERGVQRAMVRVGSLLPSAEMKFVFHVAARIHAFLDGVGELISKMVETSRRRIAYEEKRSREVFAGPRVALLNPPWKADGRLGVRAGSRWPFTSDVGDRPSPDYLPFPFFLAYATAKLKEAGFDAVIVDAVAEGLSDEEFFERVAGFAPDLIVIECSTPSIGLDTAYGRRLKLRLPHAHITFAGTHVTALGKEFLARNPFVDSVIQGEYEEAVLLMAESIKESEGLDGLKGILFRDAEGNIAGSGSRTPQVDISALPLPERLTLPIYSYFDGFAGMPFPNVQMHASRGCPFGCIFCVWPQILYGSPKYRVRDPLSVVDEMEMLIRDYGFKAVYFDDDTFNIGKERMIQICSEIRRRNIRTPWAAMARADTSDFETFRAMKDAGICAIKFGVESGVQDMVNRAGKGLDLARVEESVGWCRTLQIPVHLTFTFGLPGETHETVKETVAYALKLNPNSAQFSLTTPFPGTKYFHMLKEKGHLLSEDWSRYDGARYSVVRGEALSREDLRAILAEAERIWGEHTAKRGVRRN